MKVNGDDNSVFMVDISKILLFSESLSVLYIEADQEAYEDTYDVLQHIFHQVQVARDMQEAIETFHKFYHIHQTYPEIVIIDINISENSGIDLCREFLEHNPQQMIVISTDTYTQKQLTELIRLNIHYFLLKPMELEQLYKTLYDVSQISYEQKFQASRDTEVTMLNQTLHQTITELQESIETEKRNSKIKDLFFANMSHEIRTPMNAVIGLSHILLETELNQKQFDYLSKIQSSGSHLLNIINDILDFSKIEAGKLDVEFNEFDINEILESISYMIGIKAQEKGVELIFDIDHSVPAKLMGDSLRLGQIIINLLNNAVKFTESGEVILKVRQLPFGDDKSIIEFEVIDTGIGMTDEQIKKLFQPFAQADESISRTYGGSGLGLLISKQLVEMMGGEIKVESRYGEGSKFTFTIVTLHSDEKRKYRLPSKDLMNKQILIVDTNQKTMDALADMLRYFHYTASFAMSPEEVQELIIDQEFDITFVDYDMLTKCQNDIIRDNCNTKVVLMQSGVTLSDETIINGIDIHAYLHKPFNQQMILSVILNLYSETPNYSEMIEKNISKDDLKKLRGSHIYLAEDNEINQTVMIALLEDTGIKVTVFKNGQELLDELAIDSNVDLILMDIYMPILDGYKTAQMIRQNSAYDHIPIIALTASAMKQDIDRALETGMIAYISKPIHVQTLYTLLQEHIEEKTITDTPEIEMQESDNKKTDDDNSDDKSTEDKNLEIFEDFYKNTLISLEEDMKESKVEEVTKLLKNLQDEAEKVQIESLQTIDKEFTEITQTRDIALLEHLEVYNELTDVFLISIKAIQENKLNSDKEKNYVSKVLNVDAGIDKYEGDAKLYRSHLFAFADYLQNSSGLLKEMIAQSQFEEIKIFSLKLKEESEKIKANIMTNVAVSFEMILLQYNSDIDKFLQQYKELPKNIQE